MNYEIVFAVIMAIVCFVRGMMNIIYPHPIPPTKPRRGKIIGPRLVRIFGVMEVLLSIAYAALCVWRIHTQSLAT